MLKHGQSLIYKFVNAFRFQLLFNASSSYRKQCLNTTIAIEIVIYVFSV